VARWRNGTMLDLQSRGRGLDSVSGYCQVVMCLHTGEPSWYIISTKISSIFHPSRVCKSSTGLSSWGWGRHIHLCQVADNTVWSHVAGDASWLWDHGIPM